MSYTNSEHFINAFNAMRHHLAEQEGSKLKGLFAEEVARGEKHFFDRIGSMEVSEITGLAEPIVHADTVMSRRMATVADFDASALIHDIEKLKMLSDPTNDIVRKLKNAHARNYDDVLINALLGTAATGQAGAGTASFTAGNIIAHGSTGVTLAKFLEGLRILEEADVDTDAEDVFCLLTPRAKEDMLAITNFSSTDFQLSPTLSGKMLPTFRGVKFVTTNRVPDSTADSVYRIILCTGDSLRVAKRAEPKVDISQRKDLKNQPFQLYTESSVGAVRMEEAKVVSILFQ